MGRYDEMAHYIGDDIDDSIRQLTSAISNLPRMQKQLYQSIKRNDCTIRVTEPTIDVNFVDGPKISINDAPNEVFDVTFTDERTGIVHFHSEVGNGCWAKSNVRYAVDWVVRAIRRSDGKVFETRFDAKEKRVYVALESKSLGDTLAWFPQVEEFRKKWGCYMVCSTFWNEELEANYPDIEFVHPGAVVNDIYAMYLIGWFYGEVAQNPSMHPRDFKELPLAQTAADILALDYKQVRASINKPEVEVKKRIGFGFHSTAQTKYWNNPTGWQEITNFFVRMGYEVVILSNEGDGYMGNRYPEGAIQHPPGNFQSLKEAMLSCEIFVGLGSGLSWLAWTLGVKTVLISGFSEPQSEFVGDGILRIFNQNVCNGCYNRYRFNPGDWNWCPDHKDTERQFECTKSITAKSIISKLVDRGWIDFT